MNSKKKEMDKQTLTNYSVEVWLEGRERRKRGKRKNRMRMMTRKMREMDSK